MYDEKAFIKFQALYDGMDQNKTSTQWTPGSQVYLNKKKKNFGQK